MKSTVRIELTDPRMYEPTGPLVRVKNPQSTLIDPTDLCAAIWNICICRSKRCAALKNNGILEMAESWKKFFEFNVPRSSGNFRAGEELYLAPSYYSNPLNLSPIEIASTTLSILHHLNPQPNSPGFEGYIVIMPAPPSSYKVRKKKKGDSPGEISSNEISGPEKKAGAQSPAFPLVAFFWPARKNTSQWVILPLVLMVVGLFRWCAGLWGYSGTDV